MWIEQDIQDIFFFAKVEIKDNNVIIDRRNVFDQPFKNLIKIYDNIRDIATGQWDDLSLYYIKEHYKMIAID